jgi:hypothetical protein
MTLGAEVRMRSGRLLRGCHVDPVEGFERCGVVVLASLGSEFTRSDGGHVQELPDHAPQCELDLLRSGRAAVLGADPLHLGVEDRLRVPAQCHDRRVHGAGGLLFLEGPRGAAYEVGGLRERVGLLLGGRGADGLEGDEFDVVEGPDGGVEVVAQGEVDDDERAVAPGADPFDVRGVDPGVAAAAADDDVGAAHGARQVRRGDGGAAAGGDEALGASGGGEDGDVRAAALLQRGHRGARIRARAEQHDGLARPVGVGGEIAGELEGHGDDGPAPAAERRLRADVLRGLRGGLEQAHEAAAGSTRALRLDECAAHLARDLAFTDHGGIEPGADGEEVFGHALAGVGLEGRGDRLLRDAGVLADGRHDRGTGGLDVVLGGRLGVDLETVAGRQDDGTGHGPVIGEYGSRDLGCPDAQSGDRLQVHVRMCRYK